MKKMKESVCIIVWIICIIGIIGFFLPGLRPLLSWEKTRFSKHEDFEKVLYEYNSFGGSYFSKELPTTANELKYYWYIRLARNEAVYSMLVSEEDYHKLQKERLRFYQESDNNSNAESVIYVYQGGEQYYIEDSELYRTEMACIEKVLHNQEVVQQYYFLVINEVNTVNGPCYNGVILNDTLKEIVEFSVQVVDEDSL